MGTRTSFHRFLTVLVAFLLAAAPSFAATKGGNEWHEAPMLHQKVTSGGLPALAKRLPKDPMVEKVTEEIGQYGGDMNLTWQSYSGDKWSLMFTEEALFRFAPDGTTVVPNVAKGVDINADYTQFTIHLREGMKWSDGEPFDADDVLFYWEHMLIPETFGKKLYDCYFTTDAKGEKVRAKVEKIDQYTVKITHAASFPLFLERVAIDNKWFFAPEHYYKTILPEYIGEAKALEIAKARGFGDLKTMGSWTGYYYWVFPDRPTLRAWVAKNDPASDRFIMERNPYYWKTDAEGNQLPYIDRIVVDKVGKDQVQLKRLAGEVDLATIDTADYAVFQSNREKGKYRVLKWKSADVGVTFHLNQTVEDLGLRKIFQDVNFRAGLSHAINREEINNIVYDGLLTPRQASLLPGLPNYSAAWEKKFAAYDPKLAASFLDKAGLPWDAAKRYRTRPDGSELTIILHAESNATQDKVVELVTNYWDKVGVKTVVKMVDATYYHELKYSNQHQLGVTGFGVFNLAFRPDVLVPLRVLTEWFGHYGLWRSSGGKQGVKPEGDVMLLLDYWDKLVASTNKADVTKWADKIVELHARNVWVIGVAGISPQLVLVSNRLRNVPDGLYYCDELRSFGVANASTFFIRK
jgi:peptide/nickel transport system substrate-binding protein